GILGVSELITGNLSDLKNENYRKAVELLQQTIHNMAPEEIYTLHPKLDRHPTHRLAGQAVLDALKGMDTEPTVWAYEVWGLFPSWDRFEDVSDQIGRKIKAIGEHKSQISTIPFDEGIVGLNRWRAVFADPQESDSKFKFQEVFIRLTLRKKRAWKKSS